MYKSLNPIYLGIFVYGEFSLSYLWSLQLVRLFKPSNIVTDMIVDDVVTPCPKTSISIPMTAKEAKSLGVDLLDVDRSANEAMDRAQNEADQDDAQITPLSPSSEVESRELTPQPASRP